VTRLLAIGRWSARHPRRVIAGWLGFVVLASAGGAATGTRAPENGAVGESARGYGLMNEHLAYPPERSYLLLASRTRRVGDRDFRAAIGDAVRGMRAAGARAVAVRRAPDGHAALVVGADAGRAPAVAAHPGIAVVRTGDAAASDARDRALARDLHRAEWLSLPVILLVLLLAFGGVLAALVPVLVALTSVAATFGLLGPISQAVALDDAVKTIVVLIGMAVGVDYALFYIVRVREERAAGAAPPAALDRATATAGRSVLVSAATVAVAMSGMYLVGIGIFTGVASATIAVLACSAAASVTVLPAVLALLGPRVDGRRLPGLGRRVWTPVVAAVLRRPVLSCAAAVALLVALALPALGLRLAKPSDEALASQRQPPLAALAAVRARFPDTATPALVAFSAPERAQSRLPHALARLEALARAGRIAHPPFTLSTGERALAGRAGAVLELPLSGAGDNSASRRAIAVLRRDLVPRTLGRLPGVEYAVTGSAAEDVDFTHQIHAGIARVIAFVLIVAFGLLLVTFRSLVVPAKAIALNLLSVAAAYGVLALVFQRHWAQPLLGFRGDGAIVAWLPLFLFVVLFGLSMDYHVLILSRVREAVDDGRPTEAAVREAIERTARVVTSAALVMVGVFSLFAALSSLDLEQAGVGLAAAVLLDATVVRAVLLPAAMTLLGERNWYLPRALRRLTPVPATNQ
jgi:RND superfamily putative drug exporter